MGPSLSSDQQSAMAPLRGTRPNVGRRPLTPQRVDGETMLPSVSEPSANPTRPAAVAEPGPADEPDEPSSRFHGFLVCPPNQTSLSASAPRLSLAASTAPASASRLTTVASADGTRWRKGSAPHVVGMPAVSTRSLAPHGTPCSGPRYLPRAISASARRAAASACSRTMVMLHRSFG